MTDKEILAWCKSIDKNQEYFVFSEDLFETLNVEQAKLITNYFDKRKLILLPVKEIEFFEWLKIAEPTVWHDLWDGELAQPYLVGIGFLPLLIYSEKRGFPICDLMNQDNYYFTPKHMVDLESKVLVESSRTRLMNNDSLSVSQLLCLEITATPIDIWHFAYKYKLDLEVAKRAVYNLVEDNVLVHLPDAEHLSVFIDF